MFPSLSGLSESIVNPVLCGLVQTGQGNSVLLNWANEGLVGLVSLGINCATIPGVSWVKVVRKQGVTHEESYQGEDCIEPEVVVEVVSMQVDEYRDMGAANSPVPDIGKSSAV
ncbi:hypothetical protein ACH5RR_026153 [Cinchona calisaya]|uniref:Uncharacterized protein n=1 Tax=Cinchona calisaya TaxID=153742 RepID=A0ABD2Z207_9GENT